MMAHPVHFAGANMRLLPPESAENVQEISTFTNGTCSVSCWELSAEEIDAIALTGRVWLSCLTGRTSPPVFVGSEETVRDVVADFGAVWVREGAQ
jgi:hypothetical protein